MSYSRGYSSHCQRQSVLDTVEQTFRLLCQYPQPLVIDGAVFEGGFPTRTIPLIELRNLLLTKGVITFAGRDAVWSYVVARAQSDSTWMLGATGLALPGLGNAVSKLSRTSPADREDLAAQILTGYVAAVRAADPTSSRLAAKLCWAAYRAGEQLRNKEIRYAAQNISLLSTTPPDTSLEDSCRHPDQILDQAAHCGVISRGDADLIGRTRLEGVSLAEAAQQYGCTTGAIKMRRHRAERKLTNALRPNNR